MRNKNRLGSQRYTYVTESTKSPLNLKVGELITSKFDDRKHKITKVNNSMIYYSENSDGTGTIHKNVNSVITECFNVEANHVTTLQTSTKTELKPLFLILQTVYFEPIIKGAKKIEYREASAHNISRLCIKDKTGKITGFRNHKSVIFQGGYNKDAKRLTVEVEKMVFDYDIIEIHLGKVLEKNF